MYMHNRYYDPQTGRFMQDDPIGLPGGCNLYGFASGDPVNFSDPFGLCKDSNGLERGRDFCPGGQGLKSAGLLDPVMWVSGGVVVAGERLLGRLAGHVVADAVGQVAVEEGIYEFPATSGKTYVGQSG